MLRSLVGSEMCIRDRYSLMPQAPSRCLDLEGIGVITGGASGFGLEVATRLVEAGMRVALLDISEPELAAAHRRLHNSRGVLPVRCDVRSFESCVSAGETVRNFFGPDSRIGFLFNNAGIMGKPGSAGGILEGDAENWKPIFDVNLFGAVNVFKAMIPGMIQAGPLPSGKRSFVVTTSSVVGLLNHNIGPYSASKMALTAVCEQMAIELNDLGPQASHISPHSLHPTIAATNFMNSRDSDGSMGSQLPLDLMSKQGVMSASQLVDGFFNGLDRGEHYIIVDHPLDVPTKEQIDMRFKDQIEGRRPRRPEQLFGVLLLMRDKDALKARVDRYGQSRL
eukprot:TRINITY_DN7781_c0_g1_i2.p1 TRINITY_DN7781_c0_g1~~TRINITY_DN7781_c0_g1_i2.p1  ORF type:complete len:361 (+),score=90.64 TRINITY_DN7781_c0_g1_i2:76-1083(+)